MVRSKKGIFLSHKNYVLDILSEVGLCCSGAKFWIHRWRLSQVVTRSGEDLDNLDRCRQLVGKLNY